MGIVGFWPFLCNQIPGASVGKPHNIDHMIIDQNAEFHNVLFNVPSDTSIDEVTGLLISSTDRLRNLINPKKSMRITADGVASAGKMMQQKPRRYASDIEKVNNPSLFSKFNRTTLTPGTTVSIHINNAYETYVSSSSFPMSYDGTDNPGEGEHRIIQYCKSLPDNDSILIVGADADIILLSLTLKQSKVYIMRDVSKLRKKEGAYEYVNVAEIKRSIPQLLRRRPDNIRRCVNDFISLLGLAGCDFLPPSPSLKFSDSIRDIENGFSNSINNLMDIYRRQEFYRNNDYLVNDRGKLNVKYLQSILEEIGKTESRWFKSRKPTTEYLSTVEPARLMQPGYQDRWYQNKLGLQRNQEILKILVTSYMKTMSWYTELMINGIPSWDHYYPYLYAPLASDISLVDLPEYFTFSPSKPVSPIEQQMLIFSKHSIREIMGEKYYQLALTMPQYYPDLESIKVDYELAENKEFKKILILPSIDSFDIKRVLQNMN